MSDGAGAGHRPVLLEQALEGLRIHADGRYVDATFGRGGHAAAILARLGPAGRLLALDRDPEAVDAGRRRFAQDARFVIEQAPFSQLTPVLARHGLAGRVDGLLMDLGVSSPQLDDPRRGFGFGRDGPLDMRMDPAAGPSAADWLASAGEEEIATVLREFGEERHARRIARALVAARREAPIRTTARLAELVRACVPRPEPGKHPATRCFQAIRIHVNRELDELQAALEQVPALLAAGGRLVVISFHSLEDRIVKRFIRRESRGEAPPRRLPLTQQQLGPGRLRQVGPAQRCGEAERAANPRARSAVLRVAERPA